MSERAEPEAEGPKQRSEKQGNIYVHKPKTGQKKPGKDRRFQMRSRQFDENVKIKMEGGEVPVTRKVSLIASRPNLTQVMV